jgi:cytochrome c oxidase subunit III
MPSAVASSRREVVPSSVLAVLLVAASEVMLFAGLISAFTISRAGAPAGAWTVPAAPLLPVAATAFNSAALVASGVCVFLTQRQRQRQSPSAARTLLVGWVLGAAFVVLQGREWWRLLSQGMTMFSSQLGAFFYLIVGLHALHAACALLALGVAWWRLRAGTLSSSFFLGAQTFWYFVVAVWPAIYGRVYF